MRERDDARLIRYGRHLFEFADKLGWDESDGEGPLEFIMRRTREIGMQDALDGHWHIQHLPPKDDIEDDA